MVNFSGIYIYASATVFEHGTPIIPIVNYGSEQKKIP